MTLAGAMRDDINVIKQGILQILPDDDHHRGVLLWDRIRMFAPHATREEIVRFFETFCSRQRFRLSNWTN
jgi:hypothetical protein